MGITTRTRKWIWLGVMMLSGAVSSSTRLAAQSYEVIDLGELPGFEYTAPTDINDFGQVVGYCFQFGLVRAVIWDSVLGLRDLGTLGGEESGANAINNRGEVVGWTTLSSENAHAFVWRDVNTNGVVDAGEMTDLGVLPGRDPQQVNSSAININNNGQIIGLSAGGDFGTDRAVIWNNHQIQELSGTLRGLPFVPENTTPYGLTNSGIVVGECGNPSFLEAYNFQYMAFQWQHGVVQAVPLPEFAPARAVNSAGTIVGGGWRWQNGAVASLGHLGGGLTQAFDINDGGLVVGESCLADGTYHAFLYDGTMRDLNEMIPANSGWVLERATAINVQGQIVGIGRLYGRWRGFVLLPGARLGVNCNNDGSMRDGVPDVEFIMDEEDERVKQTHGFAFWWGRDSGQTITLANIVDLAPLTIIVPQTAYDRGDRYFLQVRGGSGLAGLWVYPAVSPGNNRRQFVQDSHTAAKQLAESARGVFVSNGSDAVEILIPQAGTNEFVFKAVGSGSVTATLTLLSGSAAGSQRSVSDTVTLRLNETGAYWQFVSSRGTGTEPAGPSIPFDYPTDGDRWVRIQRYPTVGEAGWATTGVVDPQKSQYLVFVHGYANSLQQAYDANTELYKRLFWLGYRGNYIGFAWEGDELAPLFDPNVKNAFQASPSLMYFLRDIRARAGGADNVNLVAHSLGNFVAWDAMRLHERLYPGEKLFRNICDIQSAVWIELWDSETDLTYTAPSDPVTYSVDQLRRHSWRFWFSQAGHDPRMTLSGTVRHSYLTDDKALVKAMRINDYALRGANLGRFLHYNRERLICDKLQPCYRAPIEDSYWPWHMAELPALLQTHLRRPFYAYHALNLPAGATTNLQATENYLAQDGGWPDRSHSAFRDEPLPNIYQWWTDVLGNGGNMDKLPAISLGEE